MVISYMHTDRQRQAVAILFPQFTGQTRKQGTQTPAPTPSLESVSERNSYFKCINRQGVQNAARPAIYY